jgi:uncharacterized protein (DUF983 family)
MTGPTLDPALPQAPSADSRIVTGLARGFVGRCPNCGQGKLYRAYLKVQTCPACGHDNAQYPADDAGPYFTIILMGHLVIAPLLFLPFIWQAPTAVVAGVLLPAVGAITLVLLPRVKGAIIGLHWALKCKGDPGSDPL